jgi:hypothetical protein
MEILLSSKCIVGDRCGLDLPKEAAAELGMKRRWTPFEMNIAATIWDVAMRCVLLINKTNG